MFFSILVPVYNTEKYLETCIDSILNQTEKDYELILLDDGSTDSSPQICDRYAGLYPDTIKVRHRENKGLLLTRREQLKMASGDYIVFVDSDDYLRKDALEVLRSTIEEYNADMVMYKYNLTNDNNEISTTAPAFENGRVFTQDTKKELYSAILSTNTLNNLCTKAVKYTLFDLENSYEQASMVTSGEDLLQSLPLITSAQRVVYIDQGLYYYRRNPESMTRSVTVKSYEQSSLVGKALLEYMKIWGMANDFYMQMFYARRIKSLIDFIRSVVTYGRNEADKLEFLSHIANSPEFITAYDNAGNADINAVWKISLYLLRHKKVKLCSLYLRYIGKMLRKRSNVKSA